MKGGYRKGSGRKKGFSALEAEKVREFIAQRVSAELGPIVDGLVKKAKKGDIRATQTLFERAWGKTPQALDIKQTQIFEPITSFTIMASEEHGAPTKS